MAVLKKLTGAGDETLATWDPAEVKAGNLTAMAAVEEAERIIKRAMENKNAVVVAYPGTSKPAEKLDTFDPLTQDEILILPRMAGGC